jgi:hypothetical protein
MKTHCVFLVLLGGLLAGCKSPDEEYGDFGILMFGLAAFPVSGAVTGYETVQRGLMRHVYAAPGSTCPDFEAVIKKAEKISAVPAEFGRSPNFAADHSYLFRYEGRQAVYCGRFILETNNPSELSPAFSAGEITNLASFAARLKTPADPVSAFLLSRFSAGARLAIAGFPESGGDEKFFANRLVNELNPIVLGPSIYDENRFRGVTLRPGTAALRHLSRNPSPSAQIRSQQLQAAFNRMLLEDA